MPKYEGRFRCTAETGEESMDTVVVEADDKYAAQRAMQQSRPDRREGQASDRLEYFKLTGDDVPTTAELEAIDEAEPGDDGSGDEGTGGTGSTPGDTDTAGGDSTDSGGSADGSQTSATPGTSQ